jgi:AcrR family transcriptional regulator
MEDDLFLDHQNAGRILEEGWKMFQQKGYRGVTVDELCLRCGLTKPTLYYYFRDKETLFVRVLQHKLGGFHASIQQPGTLPERLQSTAAAILDSFQAEYSTLLRDREFLKKPENLQTIRQAFHDELFGPLNELMQQGIEQGEFSGDNPQMLTLIFLGGINNLIGKSAEMGLDNATLAKKLTQFFLFGVQKRSI